MRDPFVATSVFFKLGSTSSPSERLFLMLASILAVLLSLCIYQIFFAVYRPARLLI
jgi:hypothetical protein